MAERLARIIGTEEDRVNCPFYWKIGACRHGDQCSRSHYKPAASQTLILRHLYQNPAYAVAIAEGQQVSDQFLDMAADDFEMFYQEVWEELCKYGEIEEMVVCDNIGDHIIGNVYVKYVDEDSAANAMKNLTGRFYGSKLIQVEYTSVTDFREARCRQFVEGQCKRGGYCNFMHIKHVPSSLKRKLEKRMYDDHPEYLNKNRSHSAHGAPRSQRTKHRMGASHSASAERFDTSPSPPYHRAHREEHSHRSHRHHDRGRKRDHPHYSRREPSHERGNSGDPKSMRRTSEERRAMIAQWNDERDRKQKEMNGNAQ